MTKLKVSNEGTPIKGSPWILGFVIIYTSLQILIPLRHLLYKRNLQWTHEGSNFSWRMMADRHETNLSMTIEDPRTKDVYIVYPERLLNDKQLIAMWAHSLYAVSIYPILETTNETRNGYQKSHYQGRHSGVCKW